MHQASAVASRQPDITFPLGRLLITPGAQSALESCDYSPLNLLFRHKRGDWGDISPEDRGENERAIRNGDRIFSAYNLDEFKFWVITEADRSATTILLPEEY